MENAEGTEYVDDLIFINKIEDEGKLLKNRVSKEHNNLIKNQITKDSYYWELQNKYEEVNKNIEAYKTNMRILQFEYEKVSAQFQEEVRHRPELLNKIKTTRDICAVMQEYMIKYKKIVDSVRDDQELLANNYSKTNDKLSTITNKIKEDQYKLGLEIKTSNEKAEILNQSLNRGREIIHMMKEYYDGIITKLNITIEHHEARARELEQKRAEFFAIAQTQKAENEMKEATMIKQKEEINRIQHQNIEMEIRVKDATEKFQDSEERAKLWHDAKIKAEEKISTLEKQFADLMKIRNDLDESVKLVSTKLIQTEEKLRYTEEELQNTKDNVDKLMTENDIKRNEIENVVKNMNEYANNNIILNMDVNTKTTIIQEMSEKIETVTKEKDEISEKLRESEVNIQELKDDLERERQSLKSKEDVIIELMTTNKQISEDLNKTEGELSRTREELADALARRNEMETLLKEKEDTVAEMNEEMELLHEKLNDMVKSSEMRRTPTSQVPQRDSYFSPIQANEQEKHELSRAPSFTSSSEYEIDKDEVDRRYEAMQRGESIAHLPLSGLRKRKRIRKPAFSKR